MSLSSDPPTEDSKSTLEEPYKPRAKMTVSDVQRRKIQKLMSDPSKPAFIPCRPSGDRDPNKAPDFVYNVMGSSAGAGSGEFHVYRQIRRKEMARQKILEGRRRADNLNAEFNTMCEAKKKMEDDKTSKKRAKRQKRKEKLKAKRAKGLLKPKNDEHDSSSSSSSSEGEEEEQPTQKGSSTPPTSPPQINKTSTTPESTPLEMKAKVNEETCDESNKKS